MGGGTDFQSIATSISSAYEIAKLIISADRAFDKAELKLKLADLMVALAEARTQVADMQDQTYRLADELVATERKLAFAGNMRYEAPYYFNISDGQRDGPYCPSCWDGRQKLAIRLYQASPGFWMCNACKTSLRDSTYRDPPPLRGTF
jgi:hypothetical protein